ncbi:MAG: hypothetical protein AB8B57_08840 [Congregibacter sp.]
MTTNLSRTSTGWEFWHPRVFETPYYLALIGLCARHGLPFKYLAKANYALDHGEIGIGSKYATQMAFEQSRFPATGLIDVELSVEQKRAALLEFAALHGFPFVLKPDIGAVGKGLLKINDESELSEALDALSCNYIAQAYCDKPSEFGVFFVRYKGRNRITGINEKHFPTVIGNGRDDLAALAKAHERHTPHWQLFLRKLDTGYVPAKGEAFRLSFVGSHTMGCRFSNDSHLATPALLDAVSAVCDSQPGFNFGRLDVRTDNTEALQDGDITLMEANGVASIPTHMFDPAHRLGRAYQIFLEHAGWLVRVAAENREQPMNLLPWREILRKTRHNATLLNAVHHTVISS